MNIKKEREELIKERKKLILDRSNLEKDILRFQKEKNEMERRRKEIKIKENELETIFGNVNDGDIILIVLSKKKLVQTNSKILKYYTVEKDYGVVYITVNKPFSELISNFEKEKVDLNKVFFIDAISPPLISNVRAQNAVFIGNPKELKNISVTTTSLISKLGTANILILDSLTGLLAHNDFNTSLNFINFITNKMKDWKMTFAMVCIKELTDEKTLKQFKRFCDEVIEVE